MQQTTLDSRPYLVINSNPSTMATVTGYLRFLNIWIDAHKRNLLAPDKTVLIVGPGKREFDGNTHCPQVEEALKLWNKSKIFVLDHNQSVLNAVKDIDHPRSCLYLRKSFKINKRVEDLANLNEIKAKLISKQRPESYLETIEFKINDENELPSELPSFDTILATFSLFYPIKDLAMCGQDASCKKRVALLGKFLEKLNDRGVLYVDRDCMIALLANAEEINDHENVGSFLTAKKIDILKELIFEFCKVRVEIERLPCIASINIQSQRGVYQPHEQAHGVEIKDAYVFVRV